jgi:hypothetical protein
MNAVPMVPVTVRPEAAARVVEMGLQAELEQMLEHVQQVVPQLRSIEVRAEEPYDTGAEPGVSVWAWTGLPWQQIDAVWRSLARWRGTFFSPAVRERLSVDVLPGGNDAGQSIPGSGAGTGEGQR